MLPILLKYFCHGLHKLTQNHLCRFAELVASFGQQFFYLLFIAQPVIAFEFRFYNFAFFIN